MRVEPLVADYQAVLVQYLHAGDDLAREAALLAADELAHRLLLHRASMDDMLALHARAKARLAGQWQHAAPGSPEHDGWRRLANGEVIPVMLALLLPQQLMDHRQAERRWQAEHARLAAVFEQTDDLVLMFDAEAGLEYLNPAFTRRTGWTLDSARAAQATVLAWPLPESGTTHLEAKQATADGHPFPVAWSISPIFDEDRQLLNHVAIGRDITRQRLIDEALRQNDRLRAVTTLAAGVAHDFNNILGSIEGLTDLCLALSGDDARLQRNLLGIQGASQRAAALVRQLLSFARAQPPQTRTLSLGPWLQGIEVLLAASLPKGVTLSVAPAPGLAVQADQAQLEQVLLNLVKNAGHAMRHRQGPVRLLADRWADEDGHDWVRLQVVDQGEGIAPDVLPHIFDPFFTTKAVGEGTGLGLSAALGILRQQGGDLHVHAPAGEPTVFTVLLPPATPQSAAAAEGGT